VVVTGLDGAPVSTVDSLPEATDLLLDPTGDRVWVAVSSGHEIASIDTVVTHDADGYAVSTVTLLQRTWLQIQTRGYVTYGHALSFSVKTFGVPDGAKVSFYSRQKGRADLLLGKATVDARHVARASFVIRVPSGTIVARYAGDADHAASVGTYGIYVKPVVTLQARGYLRKSDGQYVYQAGRRAGFLVRALPVTRKDRAELSVEAKVRGHWREFAFGACTRTSSAGLVKYSMPSARSFVGVPFRAQAGYLTDSGSGWAVRSHRVYFRFVR
jgi:hypothetical protein